jgi:hypothetical protein
MDTEPLSRTVNGNSSGTSLHEKSEEPEEDDMKEPICIDCWRRDHLTFVQRLDPAYVKPGPVHRCAMHKAYFEDLNKGPETRQEAA